jgi:hypothetical protein
MGGIMIQNTKLTSIILRYEIGSISGDEAMEEIISLNNLPVKIIPFDYHDFAQFMLKEVRRKGSSFLNEPWTITGLCQDKVLISCGDEFEWKLYSSMLEDWVFVDGRGFGK